MNGLRWSCPDSSRRLLLISMVCVTPLGISAGSAGPFADPGRPTGLEAEVLGPDAVRLSWDEGKDGSNTAFYFVYRDDEAIAAVDVDDSDGWTDRGLEAWTEYTWHVVAFDSRWRRSDPSEPVTARTDDGSPPGPPGALSATQVGAFSVSLGWEPAEDPESGVARYLVLRGDKKKGETEGLTWTDDRVNPEKEYVYRVRAINGSGLEGETGEELIILTPPAPDTTPPAPPAGLRVVQP
jgi:hypothetical protein